MYDPKNVKFPLKVMLNKQKTKVLYVQANSDFVDVLLSFVTLPLATILRVLQKHDPAFLFGSITTLYKGLESLGSDHFQTEGCKQMLLNPRTSSEVARHKLKFNIDDNDLSTKYFICASKSCSFDKYPHVSMYPGVVPCDCGESMLSREIYFKDSIAKGADDVVSGVYTKGQFIISDDLKILPIGTGTVFKFLSNIGITEKDELTELMDVTFGFKEIMDLLKGAFLSDTPLTDIVLNKRHVFSFAVKHEMGTFVPRNVKSATSNTNVLVVKAIIQESTNKLLYVEMCDKFLEFLFSLLTIPLGGIEHLLGGNAGLKNIDNLYMTLSDINGDMYFKTQATKSMLLNPKFPFGHTSNSQFLPLTEEILPTMYFHDEFLPNYLSYVAEGIVFRGKVAYIKSPKGLRNYVKGTTMYMVTDDLVVTPLCTTSCFSTLDRLRVPLSDVREMELKIGLKEAMRILRASLTSTRCLSDGLINLLLEKKPKQEQ